MFGIATDPSQSERLNDTRPVLVKPSLASIQSQQKLLQVEFETNPLDKKSDYRVKIVSQSLEIKYNAVSRRPTSEIVKHLSALSQPSINSWNVSNPTPNGIYKGNDRVRETWICRHRCSSRVKQVAYSTYTDVKHRSFLLMKHNIEKIKVLDIDIDIQSSFFLLPENGVYRE